LGEDAEAEDPNDESQMIESSHFLREAFGGDREGDEFFDAEEQKRHHTGRESRWKQFRQCDAVVPPDQLEVQFALLQDIIETLPTDILDDSDKFGEELLKRGVAEILIRPQLENMARFNAPRHAFDQSLERLPSALEKNAGDHTTRSAALPLRFQQRVHDAEAEEARSLVTANCPRLQICGKPAIPKTSDAWPQRFRTDSYLTAERL
jgi:hypothetical protein